MIKDNGSFFVVFLNDKTHKKQSFTIRDEECEITAPALYCVNTYPCAQKNTNTKRLLVGYRKGVTKCWLSYNKFSGKEGS